jgi:two-component system sensor histidine kinase UhpB
VRAIRGHDGGVDLPQVRLTSTRATYAGAPARRRPSLLWLAFSIDLLVLCAAGAALALSPVTIHSPIRASELVVLTLLLGALALLSFVLIRRALAPLQRLTETITEVDPIAPGRRATGFDGAAAEVYLLADAFNRMLDRLETERRESAGRALEAQEAERLRVARELHERTCFATRRQRA